MMVLMNTTHTSSHGAADIVLKLEKARKEQGRSLVWLSQQTEIPYSTLGDLKRNPQRLRADDMITIAEVLNVPLAELVAA